MKRRSGNGVAAALLGVAVTASLVTGPGAAAPAAKATPTIAFCTDCKDDAIGLISAEYVADVDPAKYFAAADIIPRWVRGDAPPPLGKAPSCALLGLRFYEGLYGANLYRLYYAQLKNGSDLLRGDRSGRATTYPAGSKQHAQTQDELYRLMNLSYATSQELLEAYDQQDCFAKEGGAQ